jgi:hypothetical protein
MIEQATLDWFTSLGYTCAFSLNIACDGFRPERASYSEVVLPDCLCDALLPKLMSGQMRVSSVIANPGELPG